MKLTNKMKTEVAMGGRQSDGESPSPSSSCSVTAAPPPTTATFKSASKDSLSSFGSSCPSSRELLTELNLRLMQQTGRRAISKQLEHHHDDDTQDRPHANVTDKGGRSSAVAIVDNRETDLDGGGHTQQSLGAYHTRSAPVCCPSLSSPLASRGIVTAGTSVLPGSYNQQDDQENCAGFFEQGSVDSSATSLSSAIIWQAAGRASSQDWPSARRSALKITTQIERPRNYDNKLNKLHGRQDETSPTKKTTTTTTTPVKIGRQRSSHLDGYVFSLVSLLVIAHGCYNLLLLGPSSGLLLVAAKPAAQSYNNYDSEPISAPTAEAVPVVASINQASPQDEESWRHSRLESMRDLADARPSEKLVVNMSNVFEVLFKKKPFSKYWTVEQKWDDLFRRTIAVQGPMRQIILKNFMRDIEYYADMTISPQCEKDLKFIQNYVSKSTNFKWLAHMLDSTGKSEPGMLTGQMANLGHPVQCIRVRAPSRPTNETFKERFFVKQTEVLGERFRGKYCVVSLRPVMPPKPANGVVSRFSDIMNASMLSNISYTGEPISKMKQRARQMTVPSSVYSTIDRQHLRLDQVPFESELYQYMIAQRNFIYSLPRFMGVCYPSSCSSDDIRSSLQKSMDDQHQVVDIEFECEQEEMSSWNFFTTPRLICYVLLSLMGSLVFLASFTRFILLSKLQIKRARLAPDSTMALLLNALDMFSIDKCAGILFIKTKRASPLVDWTKVENNRSTSIDALKGFMMLVLVYSQMSLLGCLPVPFMWAKWSDAMFPFFRSVWTQFFINMSIWSEAFYMISAYLIALKTMENMRPKPALLQQQQKQTSPNSNPMPIPNLFSYAVKRYIRLALPMLAFILFNYVWPRLSNGFVMQDQANKLMRPCDSLGWTNFLMFHNNQPLNETCLWPSHVSASFFQLHLLSYPLIVLCLMTLHTQFNLTTATNGEHQLDQNQINTKRLSAKVLTWLSFGSILAVALVGTIYPALQASRQSLIVPFLIDYIDYDNYQRVLEWMVTPTYNHLTSYMFGLLLAFVVIRRKASRELRRLEASRRASGGSQYTNQQREGSSESLKSSSTQELHRPAQDGFTFRQPYGISVGSTANSHLGGGVSVKPYNSGKKQQFQNFTGPSSVCASSEQDEWDDDETSSAPRHERGGLWSFAKSSLCLMACFITLVWSWFWNGLAQPMSDQQTFWYVLVTKLCFCATFAYLFHKHVATRRNSSNPWMITRFLVPIGRMSLTVFYVSWLVIWFDLLASLYQWHPSHYFIFEKFNEIIFMTLILAMFIYSAFEGIVKRLEYASRFEHLKHDMRQLDGLSSNRSCTMTMNGACPQATAIAGDSCRRLKVKPFESFFNPKDKPTLEELYEEIKREEAAQAYELSREEARGSEIKANKMNSASSNGDLSKQQEQQQKLPVVVIAQQNSGNQQGLRPACMVPNLSNLSSSDRCKLNAELRANNSFASIGLYEIAGATGDLSLLATGYPHKS